MDPGKKIKIIKNIYIYINTRTLTVMCKVGRGKSPREKREIFISPHDVSDKIWSYHVLISHLFPQCHEGRKRFWSILDKKARLHQIQEKVPQDPIATYNCTSSLVFPLGYQNQMASRILKFPWVLQHDVHILILHHVNPINFSELFFPIINFPKIIQKLKKKNIMPQ